MTENQLINKRYYEQFLHDYKHTHPVQVLGDLYLSEQKKEIPELSYIRFAQGEVYFHHKDYEAAIFKWENISNELGSWAKKNIADAFYKLELYVNAEDMYKSITTDSIVLNTEIGLQLFSLYVEQGKLDSAFKVIKTVVSLNPDYLNVTELALNFFEEQQDWQSAVELVASEAIRTESLHWFDFLKDYIEKGYTKDIEPAFFHHVLQVLFELDQHRFEDMLTSLSKDYRRGAAFFAWVDTLNVLFDTTNEENTKLSANMSTLFKEIYFELLSGRYLLNQLEEIIPRLLTNWVKMTDTKIASAAALAWNELFPSSLKSSVVHEAEYRFHHSPSHPVSLKEAIGLFEAVLKWLDGKEVRLDYRLEWLIGEMTDLRKRHLLVAEMNGNGKSSFINFVLGENISRAQTSTTVMYQYHRDMDINEMTSNDINELTDITEFHKQSTIHRQSNEGRSLIDFRHPSPFLHNNKVAIIDTPGFNGNSYGREEVFHYLHAADSMIFVLNASAPLRENELEVLLRIREIMPDLNIHFLLKLDNPENADTLVANTKRQVQNYFSHSEVLPFWPEGNQAEQKALLTTFIESYLGYPPNEQQRVEKLLYFMRKAIRDLSDRRVEMEGQYENSIEWSAELLSKLSGAVHQLADLEDLKTKAIQKLYSDQKAEMKAEIAAEIPNRLRSCVDLLSEESDFGKINEILNKEMNNRVKHYLEKEVLPKFNVSLNDWIAFSEEELLESQTVLHERSEGFNIMFGEEKIKLQCDFKILEDWRRDADRMTSGITMDNVNILNKFTPTQFLLRSAGKLLGSISQNKSMLYNKYKAFVENENYQEAAEEIVEKFLLQFDIFEKTLERDLKLFFKHPFQSLEETIAEMQQFKRSNEDHLDKLRQNPELFRDPLSFFELRVRQYEWMLVAGTNPSYQNQV
jgi:tetratricopeptide (TPR) repeat protein/GTPase Era involved in 16S rRNA processing